MGTNPIWKYRIKTQDGIITIYKSRLCVNGMFMRCDPFDTFVPVSQSFIIKIIYALAVIFGVPIHNGDVPSAYVKTTIDSKMMIYMTQAKGFEVKGKENWLAKLKKLLYGIPPAGKHWNDVVKDFLFEIDFIQSIVDLCLFVKQSENGLMLISLTVDDFLDLATNSELRKDIISQLKKKFNYMDNREATWFLGMKITQTKNEIQVDQSASIKSILKKFLEVNPQNVPAVPGKPLMLRDNDEPKVKINY